MIQHIIIGAAALLGLVGVACWSIKRTHDEIRSRNQYLAEVVDRALQQRARLMR